MIRRALALLLLACLTACSGAAAVRVTHATVVALGATVTSLRSANATAYERATNDLISQLARDAGTSADYERLVAPMTAEFRTRSDALVALGAALYAAAGINDAARSGGSIDALRAGAREVLVATHALLDVLARGAILPPVAVPPGVRAVLAELRAVVGDADAGAPDGGDDGR